MTHQTLTALYDTRGAAETARDQLVELVSPWRPSRSAVSRMARQLHPQLPRAEDEGFWASLSDLFMPDEDRYTYAEGMRRGGYLLTVARAGGACGCSRRHPGAFRADRSGPAQRDLAARGLDRVRGRDFRRLPPHRQPMAKVRAWLKLVPRWRPDDQRTLPGKATASCRVRPPAGAAICTDRAGDEVIQAAEEELRVGKREVGGGRVRVRSYVTERPVEEQVELRQERVSIERRPVDREMRRARLHSRSARSRRSSAARRRWSQRRPASPRRSACARMWSAKPRPCAIRCANRRSRSRTIGPRIDVARDRKPIA